MCVSMCKYVCSPRWCIHPLSAKTIVNGESFICGYAADFGELTHVRWRKKERVFMFIHSCEFIFVPLKIHLLNIECLSTEIMYWTAEGKFVGIGYVVVYSVHHQAHSLCPRKLVIDIEPRLVFFLLCRTVCISLFFCFPYGRAHILSFFQPN